MKNRTSRVGFWLSGCAALGLLALSGCGGTDPDELTGHETQALAAPTQVPTFVILSTGHVSLQDRAQVTGGNVGIAAGPGDSVATGFDAKIGVGKGVIGQRIVLNDRVETGDLFVTTLVPQPSAKFASQSPFSTPPVPPPIVTFTAGTSALTVNSGQTVTRAAGNFGQVTVNGTLNLSGGTYQFAGLTLGNDGAIVATAASIVRVAGKVTGGDRSRIVASGSLGAGAFRLTVAGATSATGGVSLGNEARLTALVISRVGFTAKDRFIASGAIAASDISFGKDSNFAFNTGFSCNADAACNDGNPCTVDSCADAQCIHPLAANGTSCPDDGNQCTADACNSGICQHPANANGTVCTLANANAACSSGSCTVQTCKAGFGNCDGTSPNGCEVSTDTSLANCGACGNVCTFANAGAACVTGGCAIGACNAGFGNCNGSPSDGCEANLNSSLGNCGTCGNACTYPNGSTTCASGTCTPGACNAGFGDCDSNPQNGCEIDLQNDPDHCGSCPNTCWIPNATAGCSSGSCVLPPNGCNPSYADCDGSPLNGCEVAIDSTCNDCGCQFTHTCQGLHPGVVFNDDGLTPGNHINRDVFGDAVVPIFGYVYSTTPIDPNTKVIVSALQNQETNNPAKCDIGDSADSAIWRQVASVTPSFTPSYTLVVSYVSLYRWDATIFLTPSEWPDGGLTRLRVAAKICTGGTCVEDLTGNAAAFDDDACVAREYDQGYEVAVDRCSATSFTYASTCTTAHQIVTFVDTDPVIATPPVEFCKNNGHTSNSKFLWDEEPSNMPDCNFKSDSEAYYTALDADPGYPAPRNTQTLDGWKLANGFPANEIHATYYNAGDIGVGRDMHCRRDSATGIRSCYVTNYLPAIFTPNGPPDTDAQDAVNHAIQQDATFKVATVAMEYVPNNGLHDPTDLVRFWVFNDQDQRVPEVTLDSEGNKPVPGVCLSCHGGKYQLPHDGGSGKKAFVRPTNANFLPFDTCAFDYSKTEPGYSLEDQRDAFQQLNALVLETQPPVAAGGPPPEGSIAELIYGWYDIDPSTASSPNPVLQLPAGTPQDENWTPDSWIGRGHFYLDVVKPYCRTCHVAQPIKAIPNSAFALAKIDVCSKTPLKRMPHAETTLNRLWQGSGRAELVKGLNSGFNGMVGQQALGCSAQ